MKEKKEFVCGTPYLEEHNKIFDTAEEFIADLHRIRDEYQNRMEKKTGNKKNVNNMQNTTT